MSMAERRRLMVERDLAGRGIRDANVLRAMGMVPRESFVPAPMRARAYDDAPLPIGEGQTISQPYIVALMIEAATVGPEDCVLEVGAGSGYAAAVLCAIARQVFAIERHASLALAASQRIADLGYDNGRIVIGDGSGGLSDEAPFDAILVSAGADRVPGALLRQLKIGGRMIIPLGPSAGQVLRRIIRKGEEEWEEADLGSVRFVPLISADERGEASD